MKTLVRFKSACKSWLFLISDPLFAKSHFDLAAARTERLVLIAPFAPKILSIDFNASLHSDSASAELNLNFLPRQSFYVEILGSCRGFILLNCDSCIYVWNPSTGAHNSIDWPPNALCHTDFMFSIFIRGFGYDPSKDDYLVVFGSYNRFHVKPDDYETRIDIFSFRTKKWKQIEGTNLPFVSCSSDKDNQMGWLLNRAIHWLVFRHDVCVILGFDLTKRGVLELPLPADFEFPEFKHRVLRVLGGLLSLCAVGQDHSTAVWVMKEYTVQSSWIKTIVVSVENIPNDGYFFPICSTKTGDIVGTDLGTGLVKLNKEGQLLEHRSYLNAPYGSVAAVYTQSLLSIPCGELASLRRSLTI